MRLFRQRRWGDWDDVFSRMAQELPRMLTLKPNGFYTANPANDVPLSPRKTASCCH
jgi:hypothetical protein